MTSGHENAAITRMIVIVLGPTSAATRIISGRTGSDSVRSTITLITASSRRKYAPTTASSVPNTIAISDAAAATSRLCCAPQTTSAYTSSPRLSVPNQCAPDGGASTVSP